MSYKTILVHVNDKRRAEALLEPAVALATRFNAHLIGMHVYAALPAAPVSFPYAKEVLGSVVAAERKATEELAEIFARMTANQPFVSEWRALKVPHADLAAVVMDHGRAADLIMAGQTDPNWDLVPADGFPRAPGARERAARAGRPLRGPVSRDRAQRRDRLEAGTRIRQSRVRCTAAPAECREGADPRGEGARAGESALAPDTTIAASLARHGIKPTVRSTIAADISVGDEILSRLADESADLLVLGAYGHSRFREFVFGGVTRHIARHMTAPTLFSH